MAVWWHRQGAEVLQAMWAVPGRGFVIDDLTAPPLCLPLTIGYCLGVVYPTPSPLWAPGFLRVVTKPVVAARLRRARPRPWLARETREVLGKPTKAARSALLPEDVCVCFWEPKVTLGT